MGKKIIAPFDGKPRTVQCKDRDGNTVFRVRPTTLTPLRVKLAEFLAGTSAFGAAGGGLYALSEVYQPAGWLWGAAIVGPMLAYPALNLVWRLLLRRRGHLVLTTDEFRVRTWKGWRRYDRRHPHSFALVLHDKTQAEKDAHELQVREGQLRGQAVATKRYYTKSFHLSFEYLGQRNDVLTVYGHKEALAIVARLKACDEILDAEARMGEGIALDPQKQWDEQPGDIPA